MGPGRRRQYGSVWLWVVDRGREGSDGWRGSGETVGTLRTTVGETSDGRLETSTDSVPFWSRLQWATCGKEGGVAALERDNVNRQKYRHRRDDAILDLKPPWNQWRSQGSGPSYTVGCCDPSPSLSYPVSSPCRYSFRGTLGSLTGRIRVPHRILSVVRTRFII